MIKCPACGSPNTITKDSRKPEDGLGWRRRKRCMDCETQFTTRELVYEEHGGQSGRPLIEGVFKIGLDGVLDRICLPPIRSLHAQLLAAAEALERPLFEIDSHES